MNNKKTAKIFLGILLIVSFTKEGYTGYKETGNIWFFTIITSLSIIGCGLLFRSAFKPKQIIEEENKYSNYTWGFLKIFSIMALFGILITPAAQNNTINSRSTHPELQWNDSLKSYVKQGLLEEYRNSDGDTTINIDIFCNCMVEKFAQLPARQFFSREFGQSKELKEFVATCKFQSKK
ncbi:MAG: hypothetical protein A3F72_09150 [Bacteroidetes bacterium RIFCSPLOWO2_12_FULL_35_15]|nr:MAG: hypothetical protein A3F72_09150 [Bacteroidetes bacterium RIFCSPLOWO2_12_FULL_35_15]